MDTLRLTVTLAIPAFVVALTYYLVTCDQGPVWRLGDDN